MTNETADRYQKFADHLKTARDIGDKRSESKDARSGIRDSASESLRERAYKILKQTGELSEGVTAEDIPQKQIDETVEGMQGHHDSYTKDILSEHPNEVTRNMPTEDLEALAESAHIASASTGTNQEILRAYQHKMYVEDLTNRYEASAGLTKEEGKIIEEKMKLGEGKERQEIEAKAEKKEKERQKEAGIEGNDNVELAKYLSQMAHTISMKTDEEFAKEQSRKYAISGLAEELKQAKNDYETIVKAHYSAGEAARNTVRDLAGDKDPNKFGLAYLAATNPKDLDKRIENSRK